MGAVEGSILPGCVADPDISVRGSEAAGKRSRDSYCNATGRVQVVIYAGSPSRALDAPAVS